jgi:hypothetical protein
MLSYAVRCLKLPISFGPSLWLQRSQNVLARQNYSFFSDRMAAKRALTA